MKKLIFKRIKKFVNVSRIFEYDEGISRKLKINPKVAKFINIFT